MTKRRQLGALTNTSSSRGEEVARDTKSWGWGRQDGELLPEFCAQREEPERKDQRLRQGRKEEGDRDLYLDPVL